jgi:hypothetical protein
MKAMSVFLIRNPARETVKKWKTANYASYLNKMMRKARKELKTKAKSTMRVGSVSVRADACFLGSP